MPGPLITPITNGLGAGDTVERAVGHALLELVQRDGDTVSFRAMDQGQVIELGSITDPTALTIVAAFRSVGIEPVVKLASTEFAYVVYAMGRDADSSPPRWHSPRSARRAIPTCRRRSRQLSWSSPRPGPDALSRSDPSTRSSGYFPTTLSWSVRCRSANRSRGLCGRCGNGRQ